MAAASTDMAGSRMRDEKSSRLMVISAELNDMSTPFCVARASATELSTVSCATAVLPERTVYWLGRRIDRLSPIFAPDWANRLSYWRLTLPMKLSFECRTRRASRVTAVGVRMELDIQAPS